MAEPEELIIEGAHVATRLARAAWRQYGPAANNTDVLLTTVRTRLELFVTALFGMPIVVAAMDPPPPVTWLGRLSGARPADKLDVRLMSATDGRQIFLPPVLAASLWGLDAITMYRLLAVQQAARLARGTARVAAALDQHPSKDWFLLAEAALIDRSIVTAMPGLSSALSTVRAAALAARTRQPVRGQPDAIEACVRALLGAAPLSPPLDLGERLSAEGALEWARAAAAREPAVRARRRVDHPWYWGRLLPASTAPRVGERPSAGQQPLPRAERSRRVAEMRRRPRVREAAEDEDDQTAGTWIIRADEPQESVEDPYGLQRPTDRDDEADPEGLADSLSDLPEARVVRTPDQAREVLRSGDDLPRAQAADRSPPPRGISYPEWDYRTGRYRHPGAVVREPDAPLGDVRWADAALARHSRLTRRVRSRFERLRPRRVRIGRQPDGCELDIDACVTAAADRLTGLPVDGRVYLSRRHARRELAVAILVDVSASTDGWVSAERRVVDVEKEALLVVCEALDALGDRYGVFAFSGEGAEDVCVLTLKSFDERTTPMVRRRIAALDADRYTRIGAAVRHLTASLCREQTQRRWLLILSDGKPNDVDLYEGRYGVEDTRQAIAEARRQGVTVFCLTVDREAPRYAVRVFGRAGFAVLRRPDQLPAVLVDALRQLLKH